MPRRPTSALLAAVLLLALTATVPPAAVIGASAPPATSSTGAPEGEAPGQVEGEPGDEAEGRGGEAAEQATTTQERLDALEAARAGGTFGQRIAVTGAATPGWAGERVVNATTDDWEPAIAADPNAPWVYLLVTRYGVGKACQGNCPTPYMVLERSKDGGATWTDGVSLCACKGSGQFDPLVEVVPDTGDVYAAYMNGYNVVFLRSADHGRSWSDPVPTWGKVSWGDKPTLAVSDDGRDVYIAFNGPQGGDPWMAQSHDGGNTWAQTKVVRGKRYYFAYDADVLHDGTVVISESSITYTAPGAGPEGVVKLHAFISRDAGATWDNVVVDTVQTGEPCADCRADYYIGQTGVSADDSGRLVFVYDGATTEFGPQRIYVKTSTDEGRTWSDRTALSVNGENAAQPTVEATRTGDVRLWYMQTANGDDPDLWNVWYRSSSNGGRTWTAPAKISDMATGASYKSADGFGEPYGDYGEIGITNDGATIAIWGEGPSYVGPGGAWYNRQV